jgi:hypothetical protein
MILPLIISFYTPDWRYPEFAKNLQADCERLSLEFYIQEKISLNAYVNNCNIKPKFILECLLKFKRSVLWVDVDNSIVKIPNEMINNNNYDIIGVVKQNSELIYVNCLCFNYTDQSINFLESWGAAAEKFIDDGAFQQVNKQITDIKILKLTTGYNQTIVNLDQPLNLDVCFINRLSSSELKMQYKHKVEKK